MKKRILSLVLVFSILATLIVALPTTASAATSGTCGNNLTWTLDDEGTLTISGTGDMDEYMDYSNAPWYIYNSEIKSIIVDDGVTSVGMCAFGDCTNLNSVNIHKDVDDICIEAFYNCSALAEINIDSQNENYCSENGVVFSKDKKVLWIYPTGKRNFVYTVPNGVDSIQFGAFECNPFLTKIIIPNGLTYIGNYSFYNCTKLESIIIPNSVQWIGVSAFSNCLSLKEVYYTGNESQWNIIYTGGNYDGIVIDIDNEPLIEAAIHYDYTPYLIASGTCGENLTWTLDDIGMLSISGTGNMTNWSSYSNVPWYSSRESITSVTISDSATTIGNHAFEGCCNLTNFTTGNGVINIGNYAFSACSSLTSIAIGNSVTSIGYDAFEGCDELSDVFIIDIAAWCNISFSKNISTPSAPKSNPLYYAHKIYLNGNLITNLKIPNNVISIGKYTFYNCNYLTTVTIPDNVISVDMSAFRGCDNLTSVTISDSVTSIGNYAFSCTNLESVTIGNNVTSIGPSAFDGCFNLTNVTIPNSVTSIGGHAFDDCFSLTDVYYTGSEYDWNNISIGSYNEYLTNATIHYNSSVAIDPEPLPNVIRNISADFTGGQDIVYNADNNTYNIDSFMLIGTIYNLSMWDDDKREDYSAHNVKLELTLPDGYSFDKDTETKNKTYTYDTISSLVSTLDTIYINKPSVGISKLNIRITGDNVEEKTFTYDFNVDKFAFQVDIYRANHLLNSDIGNTMEKEYLNFDTPSKTIVDTGKSNGLSTMIDVWKLITGGVDVVDDPTKIVGFAGEQKDVYEAIIMDLLETSVDVRIMECINNDITKETKKLTDLVISDMKNLYKYENVSAYKDICSMDDDFINQLKKTVTDDFKYEHGNANDISKVSSFIGQTIEYATDLEKYCEKLFAFCRMLQLSESMKTIVQDMYNECPLENLALKTALLECTTILNSSEDEFVNMMVAEFFGVAGLNMGEFFFDKMWDNIKTKFMIMNPSAFAVLAAYKTGKYISNAAFNTDTIAEKYYKLAAVNEVEDLLKAVYSKIKINYQLGGTVQQAKNYNSMVDFMFNMLDADCKYSVTYLNETDDTLVSDIKHVFGNNGIYDAISHVEQLERKYDYFHEKVTAEWILTIADEYPAIYAQYSSMLTESIKKQKAYFINCPVDVYVYGKDGVIVGSVVNNIPYCRNDANITIAVKGDRKTIYMYGGNEYDIVYKGNDTGTMDITVTEYDDTNSVARSVYFNNLELTNGLTYTSSEKGTNLVENAYTLSNESSEGIAPDYDSLTDAEGETHTAQITRGYFNNTMAIAQELHNGENVEIVAYIPEGYEFAGWTSDAEDDIFDDASSIMTKITMPDYDVKITANIIERPTLSISEITDSSVTVKAMNCDDITEGIVILAIYNENGALEQLKTKGYTDEFTFTDFKLTKGKVKVMLWKNLNNLIPLAKSTEKMFYFEPTETE